MSSSFHISKVCPKCEQPMCTCQEDKLKAENERLKNKLGATRVRLCMVVDEVGEFLAELAEEANDES